MTQAKERSLVLVGHANVGKSVVFHALTGQYTTVSNYPGTTVDVTRGRGNFGGTKWTVYDTPGVGSMRPRTDDERVTRDILIESRPDCIVQVADAKNLSRALHLTLELSEFGLPLVLALNMSDEARERGISIDTKRLTALLGIPVVATCAITGEGISELKRQIPLATLAKLAPRYDAAVAREITRIESNFEAAFPARRAVSLALFAGDRSAWKYAGEMTKQNAMCRIEQELTVVHKKFIRSPESLIFDGRYGVVQELLAEVLAVRRVPEDSWLARFGNWSMRPLPGFFLSALILYLLYQFVGVFGAQVLVEFFEEHLFAGYVNPFVIQVVERFSPLPILTDALVGQYGILTMALTYALSIVLPIVTCFFLFFSLLEDSGYLPRLAVMLDRFFRMMGLNGRAVFPMILGLGCNTMATVTTRVLETRREKLIVSLLLTLAVPCSAQLGVILGMTAGLSAKVVLIWIGVVIAMMLVVGWSASRLLPGSRSSFFVEIPPLRIPKLSNIFKKVGARLFWYLQEVVPMFMIATFILFLMDKLRLLKALEDLFAPVVVGILGLPAQGAESFLMGFLRRDYGAAGFFKMAQAGLLDARQVTVSMVVITLFIPCFAHLLMTIKERGLRAALIISGLVLLIAVGTGGVLNWLLVRIPIL